MPELPVIGQVDDPGELDLEPIVVPICGYTTGEKPEEVIERFPFKPGMPTGARVLMESNIGANGEVPFRLVAVVLSRCLMPDAADRWNEFLDREDLNVTRETLGALLTALYEAYSRRPTKQRSGSAGTGSRRKRTSQGAQPSTEQT